MVIAESGSVADTAGAGFNRTPLTELSHKTKAQLAGMLNRKKVLRSEEGHERDWRGIASLAGVRSFLNDDCNMPMDNVLKLWIDQKPQTAEVGRLEEFLGIIDRWDVRDDIQENLLIDTNSYRIKQQKQQEALQRCSPPPKLKCPERNNNNTMGQTVNILGTEDAMCLQKGEPLPKYDACVWFADADIEYATEIITNLESPPYNRKLFSRHRDLLGGVPFEHVEFTEFMTTRCGYLIVVMTQAFLNSPEHIFLVNFTQKFQIENQLRKIIPVLFEQNLKIPPTLAVYTHVNYLRNSTLFNFWERLARSLHDLDLANSFNANAAAVATVQLPETPRIMVSPPPSAPALTTELMEKPSLTVVPLKDAPVAQEETQKAQQTLRPEEQQQTLPKKPAGMFALLGNALGNKSNKTLQHAKSFNAINVQEHDKTLDASISNLSTRSENKKKRFMFTKKIRMFTRSTNKLQALC